MMEFNAKLEASVNNKNASINVRMESRCAGIVMRKNLACVRCVLMAAI